MYGLFYIGFLLPISIGVLVCMGCPNLIQDMASTERELSPPPYFSWVVENEIAGMGWPRTTSNLEFLVNEGIAHLITLSPEMIPPIKTVKKLQWTLIPVEEFEPPTLAQIQEFIKICERHRERNEAIGVHCRMGIGRTGVMIAAYLVHFHDMSPESAISKVRLLRPGSIETRSQERAVFSYRDFLRSN